MAERLRWETLAGTMTSTDPLNNIASFENTTAKMMHFRDVWVMGSFNGMDAGDSAEAELSKSATIATYINGDSTWRVGIAVRAPADAETTDGGHVATNSKKYAKNQVTLVPGESVHLNKAGVMTGQLKAIIGYHF